MNIPKHVAIIMDGNGRWAKMRGLPRPMGHRAGIRTVKKIIKCASEIGINILTLYAFSTENWARPKGEIKTLMTLLKQFIKKEAVALKKNNVKVNVLGEISPIPARAEVEKLIEETKENTGLLLNIALNYGARQEIIRAVNKIIAEGIKNVDEETFADYLYTKGMSDPELLIRTSGEMRISNFLLWQIAYSEIYVTKTLWPDFEKKDLLEAISDYNKRERRFGGI